MIWLIGIIISIPFLWMTEYITNPDQCHLNMSGSHIIYILVLNTVFIFLPSICLTVLYALIIIKLKKLNMIKRKNLFENENEESELNSNPKKNSNINMRLLNNYFEDHVQLKPKKRNMSVTSISYSNKIKLTRIISLITLAFFSFHLPVRIFLCWSYFRDYFESIESIERSKQAISSINLLSHIATLVYFLHCISNPIIYNVFSIKFRKAFMKLIRF